MGTVTRWNLAGEIVQGQVEGGEVEELSLKLWQAANKQVGGQIEELQVGAERERFR